MARRSRDERLAAFQIIDCTMIPEVAGLSCDRLDFAVEMFERRVHHQAESPYSITVKLIRRFAEIAASAPMGTPYVTFICQSEAGKWRCRVDAYVDKKTAFRCLEFSEVPLNASP